MHWFCNRVWQAISFLASPIYTLLFAIALAYAARQIEEMKAARSFTASLSVFEEVQKLKTEVFQGLYKRFLDHGPLTLSSAEQDVGTDVLRALSHIGTLLQGRVLTWRSPRFRLDADYYVRSWLLLEGYIQDERIKRKDPLWRSAAQLVVFLGICSLFDQHRVPLVIFDPTEERPSKEYSDSTLYKKAVSLGTQLVGWRQLHRTTVTFRLWRLRRKLSVKV